MLEDQFSIWIENESLRPQLPLSTKCVFSLSLIEVKIHLCLCPTGGRFSWGDGEGLSSAHLPSKPALTMEETGPAQEKTPGLVSVCVCDTERAREMLINHVLVFWLTSQCVTNVSSSVAPLDAMQIAADVSVSLFSHPHTVGGEISSFWVTFTVSLFCFAPVLK